MVRLVRTNSKNADFFRLVGQLDEELMHVDGEDHAFYAQFHQTVLLEHCVVVYEDGKPIACGAFLPDGEERVEIKRMYTVPASRGKGMGVRILSELEKWAEELMFHSCILETGKRQPEAIALYRKCGFGRIPNYGPYKDVENSVCFEKKLRSS